MAIVINLDVVMAKRKIGLVELAGKVDLTPANLSILKNNKAKAVRFSTLNEICKALNCQPGDILEYIQDSESAEERETSALYEAADVAKTAGGRDSITNVERTVSENGYGSGV